MATTEDHNSASSALRAGPYGRQSQGKATSVEDQDRANEAACRERGWHIVWRYSDLVSASRFGTKARGGWDQLVADVVAEKLDVVVLWDTSRGDRTVETWAAFLSRCRERGVLIHATSHQRTYDPRVPRDWRVLMDDGVEAAFESEKKSVDVRRGVAGAALAGKPHGRPGYGYDRHYDPGDRSKFQDVPNAASAVAREIITRLAKRDPVNLVYRDLNDRGIPAPGGGQWSRKGLKQVAQSVRYIGKRSHRVTGSDRVELYDGTWPAIVDEDVFWRCQAVLGEEDRKRSAPGRMRFLLSYWATCSVCQAPLNVNAYRPQRRPRYKCGDKGCVGIGMWELDEWVTRLILGRLAKPDARELFTSGGDELKGAEAEVTRLVRQLDEARASYAKTTGGISAEALAAKEAAVLPELEKARQRVREARRADAVLDLLGDDDEFTEEIGRPRWDAMSVAARRVVVKSLFKWISVDATDVRLSAHCSDVDRLELAAERVRYEWA